MAFLHAPLRHPRSRFVASVMWVMALGWTAVALLNVAENSGLIEELTEHVGRLVVWSCLLLWLNWSSYTRLSTSALRSVIPITTACLLVKLIVDVTREMPAWDHVPVVGRDSAISHVLPPIGMAGATVSSMVVLYLIVRWYDEVYSDAEVLMNRTTGLSGQDLLDALVTEVGELVDCQAVVLSAYEHGHEDLHLRSSWQRHAAADLSAVPVTTPHLVPRSETPFFQASQVQQVIPQDERLSRWQASGYLLLPLAVGRQRLGFLELVSDRAFPPELPERLLCRVVQVQAAAELARYHAQQTNQAADERLLHSEHLVSIGRMAAGIAHEVNNPLCIITTQTEIARLQLSAENDDGVRESLNAIDDASQRAGRVVDSVLRSAREEPVERWVTDLLPIVQQVRDMVRTKARGRNVGLVLRHPETCPALLLNPTAIEQLLLNVVANAVEASADGGMVSVDIESQDRHVQLVVTDDGRGMDPDTARLVFDPFFSTKKGGTGLGLSIADRIARDHEAKIELDSTEGGGTTVRLRFPRLAS